jgi:hypothetical protein
MSKWWSVLAVALLAACNKGGVIARGQASRPAAEYYPLAVGNRWTYEVSILGDKRDQIVEITRHESGYFFDNMGNQFMVDAYGLRDQKRYLLQEPIEEGRTWKNVISVSSTEHYKVLEAGARCESPAGAFNDCVRVEARNKIDRDTTLVNEITFAPNVGMIRIQVDAEEASGKRIPQTRLELKKYEIKNTTPPGSAP